VCVLFVAGGFHEQGLRDESMSTSDLSTQTIPGIFESEFTANFKKEMKLDLKELCNWVGLSAKENDESEKKQWPCFLTYSLSLKV